MWSWWTIDIYEKHYVKKIRFGFSVIRFNLNMNWIGMLYIEIYQFNTTLLL